MAKKNIMIFNMSLLRDNAKAEKYSEKDGEFTAECKHTNETGIKYVRQDLAKKDEKIDAFFVFTTEKVEAKNDVDKLLKEIYKEAEIPKVEKVMMNEGLSSSFESIETMYKKITDAFDTDEETVVAHVDMTGGLRHSAMMMLAFIRLLTYNNVRLGKIIYTNYDTKMVENAAEILEMYSLIGGVDEFANYGEVLQLNEYFSRKNISFKLKDLINSMKGISEALKTGANITKIQKQLQEMDSNINSYIRKEDHGKRTSAEEKLFSVLLLRIQKEYKDLLEKKDTTTDLMIALIKWCVNKDLLQQATTFYTEWIPKYIIDSKIITVQSQIRKQCEKEKDYQNWKTYFLKNYISKQSRNLMMKQQQFIRKLLKEKKITAKIEEKNLWEIYEFYKKIVDDSRNKMNHADNINADGKNNRIIKDKIRRNLEKLEKYGEV